MWGRRKFDQATPVGEMEATMGDALDGFAGP